MKNKIVDRESNGQYKAKNFGKFKTFLALLAVGFAFLFLSNMDFKEAQDGTLNYIAPALAEEKPDRLEVKIETLKNELVEKLVKCESGMLKDPEAHLTIDPKDSGGHQVSVGVLQFYVPTVQQYMKQLDGVTLSSKEALFLAVTAKEAKDLASRMIFELNAGPNNWTRCFKALDLQKQVEFIRKLEA